MSATTAATPRAFAALALNGFREARRNRITIVVAAFAGLLVLSSALLADTAVAAFERVIVDVGLGAMSFILAVLAIFLGSGLLGREIERRTIFLIMSKPISRGLFLSARLAGNLVTLGVLLLAMGSLFLLELMSYGLPVTPDELLAIAMLFLELLVLTSIAILLSTFTGTLVSAVCVGGLYFAGHLAGDLYKLGERAQTPLLRFAAKATYYLLPNLERLNFRARATYHVPASAAEVFSALGYGLAYSGAALALAVLIFNQRDFK